MSQNEVEIVVDAKEDGLDKIADKGRRTGKEVGEALEKGAKQGEKASEDAAKRIRSSFDDLTNGLDFGGLGDALSDGLSGGFDAGGLVDSIGGSITAAGGALAGVGVAVGGFLWDGLQSAWEQDRVGGLIAAQTGGGVAAAGRLGDIAGDVFFDNFGESIAEVGEAMTSVFQNKLIDTRAPEEAIERVTKKVLTLTQTTGESSNDIARAARQLLVTGLADSLTEALDMIQHATESGLNVSEDLLDTIEEYSTQFRSLGLEGEQSFGLLGQAIEGGARDIDTAADALKEFQILAQEVGGTAARGFRALGMDAADSAEKIARGGAGAREVLAEVLNKLQAMPDSVARNSIAVDLFGTKAEDLGNALYDMDVDTAVQQFGDLEGAVDDAGRAIGDTTPALDKLGRGIQSWAETVVSKMQEVSGVMETSWDVISGGGDASDEAAAGAGELSDKVNAVADAADDAASSTEDYVGTIDMLISKQREAATGVIDFNDAQIDAQKAIADASAAMQEFAGEGLNATKTGFDLSSEAGQELSTTLFGIADTTWRTVEAMRQQNATNEDVQRYLEGSKNKFMELATGMGISDGAAQALADTLFGFPKKVVPVVGIQDAASGPIQSVLNRIAAIPETVRTDYYLYTHYLQGGGGSVRDYESSYGGRGGRAHGGIIGGDEVPRAASGGVRSSTVQINDGAGIGELVELPNGSRVMTAGTTRAMAEMGLLGGGGPARVELVIRSGGLPLDDLLVEVLRRACRASGGNVQEFLGSGAVAA